MYGYPTHLEKTKWRSDWQILRLSLVLEFNIFYTLGTSENKSWQDALVRDREEYEAKTCILTRK